MKKPTNKLMEELNNTSQLDKYLKDNSNFLIDKSLCNFLCEKFEKNGLTKADVIKRSEINEIYGYQILSGKRFPSRNKLISLCVGAEFSISETNDILRIAEYSPLFPKIKRDSVIIFCMKKKYPVWKINEELYDHNLQTL